MFDDEFLLCIQPRCDSVRLKGDRVFPFLIMSSKGIPANPRQCLIVKCQTTPDQIPTNVRLLLYPFPYRQTMLTFSSAGSSGDYIEAVKNNGIWVFENDENSFEWIADMNNVLAQKLCDLLSFRQGSIGFQEYEWLRRKSHS